MENKKYDITDEQLAAWLDENLPEDEDALVTEALEHDAYLREIVEASLNVEDKLFVDRLREIYRGKGGEDDGDAEGGGLHPVPLFDAHSSHYDWDARLVQLRQSEMAEGQEDEYRRAANAGEERNVRSKAPRESSGSKITAWLFIFLALLAVIVIGYLKYHDEIEEKRENDERIQQWVEQRKHWEEGDYGYGLYSSPVRGVTVNFSHQRTSQMQWPTDGYMNHSRSEDFTFKWSSEYGAIVDVELDGKQLVLKTVDGKTNCYTIPASKLKYGNTMQWKITFTNPDSEETYEGLVKLSGD